MRFGLKLYTTDTGLIPEAKRLKRERLYDYIELYVLPQSLKSDLTPWETSEIPIVLHAAHAVDGVNLAQAAKEKGNVLYFERLSNLADRLKTDWIIVHGGNNGTIEETIRQIAHIGDARIIIENKPKVGILGQACIGWSPSEFTRFEEEGVLNGMALDFAHASCAACSAMIDERRILEDFKRFEPKIYHLSDGYTAQEKDVHLNLGKGDRDLLFYTSLIPAESRITIETPRSSSTGLHDFISDVKVLSGMIKKQKAN